MFITESELKSVAYSYQLNQIVENDSTIVQMAIDAAVEEVTGYLSSRYDCRQIFSAENDERNPLILELTKDVALWYIIRLSNVDMIYDSVKERYDRAIEYFNRVAQGLVSPSLPQITGDDGEAQYPIRCGSMPKQTYDY